jgi:hypothetical protein
MKYIVINGIYTDDIVVAKIKENIALTCGDNAKDVYVYSWPAYGKLGFILNFIMCKFCNVHISAVQKLLLQIQQLLHMYTDDVCIVGHSFGALIAAKAVDLLDEQSKKRVIVHAYGPAGMVPKISGVKEHLNIWNKYDVVRLVEPYSWVDTCKYNYIVHPHEDIPNAVHILSFFKVHNRYTYLLYRYKSLPFVVPYASLPCGFEVLPRALVVQAMHAYQKFIAMTN